MILSETSSDRITNYQSMNGIEGKCNNFFLFLNGWADYFDLYRKLNVKIWRMIWHIPIFGEFFRLTTMRESGPWLLLITRLQALMNLNIVMSLDTIHVEAFRSLIISEKSLSSIKEKNYCVKHVTLTLPSNPASRNLENICNAY